MGEGRGSNVIQSFQEHLLIRVKSRAGIAAGIARLMLGGKQIATLIYSRPLSPVRLEKRKFERKGKPRFHPRPPGLLR